MTALKKFSRPSIMNAERNFGKKSLDNVIITSQLKVGIPKRVQLFGTEGVHYISLLSSSITKKSSILLKSIYNLGRFGG